MLENDNILQNLKEIIAFQKYLNLITSNDFPPHKLILKIGAIIILLRNLNLDDGLCNGTTLIVTLLGEYVIKADIITGNKAGIIVFIPRIDLSPLKKRNSI